MSQKKKRKKLSQARTVQATTMQVPVGEHSVIDKQCENEITSFQSIVYQVFNKFSFWETGESHSKSYRDVAEILHVSRSYVARAVKFLEDTAWFRRLSSKHKRSKFELTHHQCDPVEVPVDDDGRPKKCAMPAGEGGIFERVASGDIHWKAAAIWMLLKVKSDWRTGITDPITIEKIAKFTRFSKRDVCKYVKQLITAGMCERLERKSTEASVYQLYPKPYPKKKSRTGEVKRSWRSMRVEGNWRYSFTEEYRVNVKTGDIQRRGESGKPFRNISDYERSQLPKSMMSDFEAALFVHRQVLEGAVPG